MEGLFSCLPPTLSKNVPVWDGCHHICICVCPGGKSARRQQRFYFFYQVNHPALIQIRGVGFVIFLSTGGGVLSLMHAFEVAEC